MTALDNELAQSFVARPFAEISAQLEAHDLPFSKIYTIEDIKADQHFQARQAIIRLPDPDYGSVPAPCIVPRVTGREMPTPRSGPAVGEHNAEVYAEFGISGPELQKLRKEHVI